METQTPQMSTYLQNADLQTKPSPDLQIIEQELEQIISGGDDIIQEICHYLLRAGGKRIRPLMVLYSGLIFSEVTPELIRAAAAVELVHMASLVHDDIIDAANQRHGQPTIHQIWSLKHALLCGDYLFTKAFEILAANNTLGPVLQLMTKAIQHMCRGELLQAGDQFNCNIDIERYYDRITQKTAIFIQSICKSGAIIGKAAPEHVKLLSDFGLHFGIAFQIKDDIMDFCGDARDMGKPKYEDLYQGNLTLPVIIALNHQKYGDWMKKTITKHEFQEAVLKKIEDILKETGSLNKSLHIAALHIEWSKYCLTQLPESPYVQSLDHLANMLLVRTF